MHAFAARDHGQRYGSGSGPSGKRRVPQHQRHGLYTIPGRRLASEPARAEEPALRAASAGGAANIALMDLLLQHGADVNAQVTGTKTYSMRISRAPSSNEGMTALHVAAQAGRTDLVRYLLEKGANTEIADSNGHKAIDLVGARAGGNPSCGCASGGRYTFCWTRRWTWLSRWSYSRQRGRDSCPAGERSLQEVTVLSGSRGRQSCETCRVSGATPRTAGLAAWICAREGYQFSQRLATSACSLGGVARAPTLVPLSLDMLDTKPGEQVDWAPPARVIWAISLAIIGEVIECVSSGFRRCS